MKVKSPVYGDIGANPGPISIPSPRFLAHQCSGSTPLEKKRHPNRTGAFMETAFDKPLLVSNPKVGTDSIHGSAKATPAPLRKERLEIDCLEFVRAIYVLSYSLVLGVFCGISTLVTELFAGDNQSH